jgi:hypothetical protein
MQQTRAQSLIEVLVSTSFGFLLSFVFGVFVLPHYGVHGGARANFEITCLFTVLSFARQYLVRRWFNTYFHKFSAWLAALVERFTETAS